MCVSTIINNFSSYFYEGPVRCGPSQYNFCEGPECGPLDPRRIDAYAFGSVSQQELMNSFLINFYGGVEDPVIIFWWSSGSGLRAENICARRAVLHRVSKKLCHRYFLNNSVKHWPMLIIFGMQHQEETLHK